MQAEPFRSQSAALDRENYVERKFVFATRPDYIRCPHVCVRILRAVRIIFEEVSGHAAYHPVTRVRLAIGRRGDDSLIKMWMHRLPAI
jgi:hypothetical protein